MTLQDFFQVVWRRFWVVVISTILLTGAVVGFSLSQTPMYEASIEMIVGQKQGSEALGSDVQGLQTLTPTMAKAVESRPVAEAVVKELNLEKSPEALLENLSANQVPNTQFIEVSYLDTNPKRAQRVVNAVGDEFSAQISDVSPTSSQITATVWARAVTPDAPVSPDPLRYGFLAFIVGGMLGVGLAFLLEYVDNSWQSPNEVEQISGVPTFGVIPTFKRSKGKEVNA
jgi:capsular polysaccharide biosynthesis protein